MAKKALLIVDVQNDFCPGGALHVPDGDRVVGPANRLAARFIEAGLPVLASRDWHPPVTKHFSQYGGVWPVHCVQNTTGADFHPHLRLPDDTVLLYKGGDPERDAYSAFDAVTDDGESLEGVLVRLGIGELCICGLATDYCVKSTALDALARGLQVLVAVDAVAGVDLVAGDADRALDEMVRAGARLCRVASEDCC